MTKGFLFAKARIGKAQRHEPAKSGLTRPGRASIRRGIEILACVTRMGSPTAGG